LESDNVQYDFFRPVHEQEFEAWKLTLGARHVLKYCYKFAARYAARYRKTGRRVSMKLIWELVRDHYGEVCRRCLARGIKPRSFDGYALNNIFTAYVARHIMDRRRDWAGMFETRGVGHLRKAKAAVFIQKDKRKPKRNPAEARRPA
jgi:hypothetical protein